MSEILVKVTRGNALESVHRGSLIVIEGDGNLVAEIGDASKVTFWRSAAKAFQMIPVITSGAADAYDFSEKEIALACASHSGEEFHTESVREMLEKTGFSEADLLCGAHLPFHEETAHALIKADVQPNQTHNNCSGKHAAMLAFARHLGANPAEYIDPENPVQKLILETVSIFTSVAPDKIKIAVDGCSAPNFAVPLHSMALAFAKLVNPENFFAREKHGTTRKNEENSVTDEHGSARIFSAENLIKACQRIVAAQTKYPEYVGGSRRLDTKIMQALPGRIVCKVGAEGVWTAGVLPSAKWTKGLAIAFKIDDGDDHRARPAAAVELLRQLGILDEEAEEKLREFSPMILKNRREIEVGKVSADFRI